MGLRLDGEEFKEEGLGGGEVGGGDENGEFGAFGVNAHVEEKPAAGGGEGGVVGFDFEGDVGGFEGGTDPTGFVGFEGTDLMEEIVGGRGGVHRVRG